MVKVRVPATSANMGPGFDTLGIALDLYNDYEFSFSNNGINFEGVDEEFANDNNIILVSMKKAFNKYKYKYKGINIKILRQDIPVSRGLGSSSSCIVAGLMGAYALMNKAIDKDEIFDLATQIEGHPDNVGPAIYGGMVVSIMDDEKPIHNRLDIKEGVYFVALVPDFKLLTKKARSVLPEKIPFKDGVYNVGRSSLLVSCFANGNYKLLRQATKDKLHEPYRSELIYKYYEMNNVAFKLGALSCFISGAGPTLMAILEDSNNTFVYELERYLSEKKINWSVKRLTIDKGGAKILNDE